jgi:hypothetical protein
MASPSLTEWHDILRPLHAFAAAEIILAELSEINGEEVLFPGVTISRRAKLLGCALHAWAQLAQAEALNEAEHDDERRAS